MGAENSIDEIKTSLIPIFSQYNIKKAVLFGSFAKGSAGDKSDVDLLVDSSLRGLQFVGLMEDVRTAIGREVDLFDVSHIVKGSPIDQEIAKTGVTIYEK